MEPMRIFHRDSGIVSADPSYTTPGLTANLVLRVLLALVANATCLVPLRLLYRNGEFAAAVFIIDVELLNLETVVNALLWRDDNVERWWLGYGLCDVDVYLHNAAMGLYVTCLCAMMRNLARQVGLLRASPMTVRERRRRNLVQALVMFPLPVVQLAWTWPLTAQRYQLGTLVGCSWVPHPSWPNLVFFILAPCLVALTTAGYAVLTYFRFRNVAKTTQTALSSNRTASRRSQRTRRRLYMMVLSILVPFLPVVIALTVVNILNNSGVEPFDYDAIHHHAAPLPWNTIAMYPSSAINWMFMNNCYIAILTAVPIFLFFGTTKDAMNQYRLMCLFFGLGRICPRLNDEYDPDSSSGAGSSFGSSQLATVTGSSFSAAKVNCSASSRHFNILHSSFAGAGSQGSVGRTIDFAASADLERGHGDAVQRPEPSLARHGAQEVVAADPALRRNPFPFRTRLNFPLPFSLAPFKRSGHEQPPPEPTLSLEPFRSVAPRNQWDSPSDAARTRHPVWPEDEARLFETPTGHKR